MRWHRSATLLSVITFLAFGFMVIGVFSDPVSKGILPIASEDGYNYGVLGYCKSGATKSDSSQCSGYGIGYTLQGSNSTSQADSSSKSSSGSTKNNLTKAFILHIIAAGLLLISLLLVIIAHFRSPKLMVAIMVFLALSFIAAIVAFVIEIYVFRTNLKFAGWFGLPAAVLALLGIVGSGITHRQLKAEESRSLNSSNGKVSFTGNNDSLFKNGGDFVVGRDDEKLLKPNANVNTSSFNRGYAGSGFQSKESLPSAPANNPNNRYKKLPEVNTQFTPRLNNALPSQIPVGQSGQGIGAVPREQQRNGLQDASRAAAVAGAASALGSRGYQNRGPQGYQGTNNFQGTPRSQRQDTWSQIALQKDQTNAENSDPSSQYTRVPAGQYVPGVENTERFGPNVVQIPKVREGGQQTPESAALEYHKDETQMKSPIAQSRVPNFSRMSSQEPKLLNQSGLSGDQFSNAGTTQYNNSARYNNVDAYNGNITPARKNSPDSEASHYTSISQIRPSNTNAYDGGIGIVSGNQNRNLEPQFAHASQNHDHYAGYSNQYAANVASAQPQQIGYGSQYAPSPEFQNYAGYQNYQNHQDYREAEQAQKFASQGYSAGTAQVPYGQPDRQYYSGPQVQQQHYPVQSFAHGASPRQPAQKQSRSSVVLENNPDFSVGNLGKKVRPNRRRP